MDADEFIEWMAYEMTCDPETAEKLNQQIALENSSKKTAEQRAQDMRNMFSAIGAS